MANGDYGIETRVARVEQRVSDLDTRVTAMTPMTVSVIRLVEQVGTLRRDLAEYKHQFDEELGDRDQREREIRRERKQARIAMWTLTVMILCALIGAIAVIVASAH